MAVALCVHSVLEGAALGAQREIAKTFHIFVAILAHKVESLLFPHIRTSIVNTACE